MAGSANIHVSDAWLCWGEVGVSAAEEKPGLNGTVCIELDAHVRGEEEIGVLGADVSRREADFDIGGGYEEVEAGVDGVGKISSENYSNFSPGLAILSSRHETQYSRLFRS